MIYKIFFCANYKKITILSLIFYTLLMIFYCNALGTVVDDKWFKNHQVDSEKLVIDRIENAKKDGFISNSLLMSRVASDGNRYFYFSSSGAQGSLFALLYKLNPKNKPLLETYKIINCILLSAIFTFFIYIAYKHFGIFSSIILFTGIIYSDWIIVFARNLYWILWIMYIPLALSIIHLNNQYFTLKWLCLSIWTAVFFKSLSGYEYLSSILIAMVLPFIYSSIATSQYKNNGYKILLISICSISGFICSLIIHFLQLAHYFKSFDSAKSAISNTILKRTHGNLSNVDSVYHESLSANIIDVVELYYNGSYHIGDGLDIKQSSLLFLFCAASLCLVILDKAKRKSLALTISFIISLLAPISWYTLAKGHSFIHTHMNHILWNIPTNLIGFLIVGFLIDKASGLFRGNNNEHIR